MKIRPEVLPKVGRTPVEAPQAVAFQSPSTYPVAPPSGQGMDFPAVQRFAGPHDHATPEIQGSQEAMPHTQAGPSGHGVVQGIFNTKRIQAKVSSQTQPILRAIELVEATLLDHPTLNALVSHPLISVVFTSGSAGTAGTYIYPTDKGAETSIKRMSKQDLTQLCAQKVGITCDIGFDFGGDKEGGKIEHQDLALIFGDGLGKAYGYKHTQDESFWAAALVHEIAVHIGPYMPVIQKLANGDPSKLNDEDFKLLASGGEEVEHKEIHSSSANFEATMYGQLLKAVALNHGESTYAEVDGKFLEPGDFVDMYHQYALADVARYKGDGKSNPDATEIQEKYKLLWSKYIASKPKPKPATATAPPPRPSSRMEVKERVQAPPLRSASSRQVSLEQLFKAPLEVGPVDPVEASFSTFPADGDFLETDEDGLYEYRAQKGQVWRVPNDMVAQYFAPDQVKKMKLIGTEFVQDLKQTKWFLRYTSEKHQCHYFERATK